MPALASTRKTSHKPTKTSVKYSRHSKTKHVARRGAWKRHGQQGIKEDRARDIQTALIREHYLDGEASGVWDTRTQAAMQKFQADNGWQTKVLPDSRALIKLGLGPDHAGLLNPETAAIPASASSAAKSAVAAGTIQR
ncbi:MAG: peptidoglycan-binding protein [Candidatus Koribacter versatilis]|uniref:Peptidoglycan-binding protein n=1 Tax=Candidatus Korobacter versatilis TaxID=658062 RepID=A0A932A6T8_9BACT|nr:peptidoglycan-binding protein [Candidatus Koribacter versatilis]